MQDTVAAIHDIAFARNEHILTLRKENLSRFTRFVGETEKLEKDGRRWRRRRRCVGFGRVGVRRCLRPRNFLCLRSNCSVGSSVGAATRAVLPLAELRRAAGRGFVTCVGAGAFDVFADAGEFELLNNALPAKITASAPSTRAQISLVRFSAPIFNYPPDFK